MSLRASLLFLTTVLIAFLMGRWAPSRDLRVLRKEMETIKEVSARNVSGMRGSEMDGMTRMLQIPPERRSSPRAKVSDESMVENRESADEESASLERRHLTPEERRARLRERIAEAQELWSVRSDLIRDSFLSHLEGEPHHNARNFDVLVSAMNLRVDYAVSNWVERVKAKQNLRREDGLRLFHEVSAALIETYNAMDEKLPPDWRDAAGENFQLFDLIDPRAGERFLEIEDLMIQRDDFGSNVEAR